MIVWSMPPKAKIYEALTAVADKRVRILDSGKAEVVSSGGDATYLVEWSEDGMMFSSTDNASFWQCYMGYPIIAVLMVLGRLEYTQKAVRELSAIRWNEINRQFHRDYNKAVDSVLRDIQEKYKNSEDIVKEVNRIYDQLEDLHLQRLPRRKS